MLTQTYFPNYVLASTQHYGMLDLGRALTRMRNVLPHPSSMGMAFLGGSESSSKVKIHRGAPAPGLAEFSRAAQRSVTCAVRPRMSCAPQRDHI